MVYQTDYLSSVMTLVVLIRIKGHEMGSHFTLSTFFRLCAENMGKLFLGNVYCVCTRIYFSVRLLLPPTE